MRSSALRVEADEHEAAIKDARGALEALRAVVAELDIARATAESRSRRTSRSACVDAVQATLDEVSLEVEQLERDGDADAGRRGDLRRRARRADEDAPSRSQSAVASRHVVGSAADATQALSAEEAIATLRGKIERLGPVNMMAIEQFDELETRHAFLTTQRKDLVDSIAQTSEAIKRIDETTRAALHRGVRRHQPATSRRPSARSSAAAAPA